MSSSDPRGGASVPASHPLADPPRLVTAHPEVHARLSPGFGQDAGPGSTGTAFDPGTGPED
jgi:hypothetical protein